MIHAEGPLLSIDLDERTSRTEAVDGVLASYVGGRGVATRLAHERIPFDAAPLGPENRLYLATGPMQASKMSFTGRMNATAVSPLTDGLASSNAGGFLSRNFADAGYAVVEIRGAADELTMLHVTDDGVEFEAVPDLAGAEVPAITDHVESRFDDYGPDNVAGIGPAGENEVRFASIMTSETRAFGRGGPEVRTESPGEPFDESTGMEIPQVDVGRSERKRRPADVEPGRLPEPPPQAPQAPQRRPGLGRRVGRERANRQYHPQGGASRANEEPVLSGDHFDDVEGRDQRGTTVGDGRQPPRRQPAVGHPGTEVGDPNDPTHPERVDSDGSGDGPVVARDCRTPTGRRIRRVVRRARRGRRYASIAQEAPPRDLGTVARIRASMVPTRPCE